MENQNQHPTGIPAPDNEVYDEIFDKQDRTGIIAGIIDLSILGIGVIVALLWQFGLISHQSQPSSANWQTSPFQSASNASSTPKSSASASNAPSTAHVDVCQAFVKTTFKNGQTHYVEFRGNCKAILSMAKNSKTPVRVMPVRRYTIALTGNGN